MRKNIVKKSSAKPGACKKNMRGSSKKTAKKGVEKHYLKTSPMCRVTFRLPKEAAPNAQFVSVVGDFNNWELTETPLKKLKNGDFKTTLSLPCNREYRFRYLIDADRWENDWCADKYVPGPYGCDDSVVII